MALRKIKRQRAPQAPVVEHKEEAGEKRVFSRVECLMDLELEKHGERLLTEEVEAIDLSRLLKYWTNDLDGIQAPSF